MSDRSRIKWTDATWAWVLAIRDHCRAAGVPLFFKHWGGTHQSKADREFDGHVQ